MHTTFQLFIKTIEFVRSISTNGIFLKSFSLTLGREIKGRPFQNLTHHLASFRPSQTLIKHRLV
uniref:Uncharacterized protein n=1 Tax=Rhizophora mucronata TaxID=61149 RepID=A0A2P2IT23_RHIMU